MNDLSIHDGFRTHKGLFFVYLIASFILGYCILGVDGHAIFWEPPSRASLGKHNNNFCNVLVDNNHMSLWCGGQVVSGMQFIIFFSS